MSPDIWVPVASGLAAMFGSWTVFTLTIGRQFGRVEAKMEALQDDMRDMKNDRDLVRWSVLGPMIGTLPRLASQEAVQS